MPTPHHSYPPEPGDDARPARRPAGIGHNYPPAPPDDAITARMADFVRRTGLSERKIRSLIDEGEIESRLVGRLRLIIVDSYRRYLDRLAADPPVATNRPPAPPTKADASPPAGRIGPAMRRLTGRPRRLRAAAWRGAGRRRRCGRRTPDRGGGDADPRNRSTCDLARGGQPDHTRPAPAEPRRGLRLVDWRPMPGPILRGFATVELLPIGLTIVDCPVCARGGRAWAACRPSRSSTASTSRSSRRQAAVRRRAAVAGPRAVRPIFARRWSSWSARAISRARWTPALISALARPTERAPVHPSNCPRCGGAVQCQIVARPRELPVRWRARRAGRRAPVARLARGAARRQADQSSAVAATAAPAKATMPRPGGPRPRPRRPPRPAPERGRRRRRHRARRSRRRPAPGRARSRQLPRPGRRLRDLGRGDRRVRRELCRGVALGPRHQALRLHLLGPGAPVPRSRSASRPMPGAAGAACRARRPAITARRSRSTAAIAISRSPAAGGATSTGWRPSTMRSSTGSPD